MALILDEHRIPRVWAEKNSRQERSIASDKRRSECINLALINNMPDAALEDTELQFFQLLEAAAADLPVFLRLYSLPQLERSDRARQHLASFYSDIEDLWNGRLDGIIVTGTEPRRPNLQDEPYWPALVNLFGWAQDNTVSTVLSCLAAHAGVLYSDGIERHPLSRKQCGVFPFKPACGHALTAGMPDVIHIPHSRWNELPEDALLSCGYRLLTQSTEAGVDLFVKKKGRSLFVHFQGHPEYEPQTLFKEYRRDVRRFLKGERETYPSMPHEYFDSATTQLLTDFREKAMVDRCEEVLPTFPEVASETIQNKWRPSAICVYHNWLRYVASKKAEASAAATFVRMKWAVHPSTRNHVQRP
jgi:homoserine O-succinyltransferase